MMNFTKNRRKRETNPEKLQFLTQEYAEKRAKLVKSKTVTYDLNLILQEGTYFEGFVRITFELARIKKNDLYIDYSGRDLRSLRINRHTMKSIEWNGHFLKLKHNYLIQNGVNIIEIGFENSYSNNGCGLHSFIDPEDNLQYLYSQCGAYYCNMIFPNFDQPDIKAKLILNVRIPETWTFIGNESQKSQQPSHLKGYVRIQFHPTAYMSTYLYAFIAGHYSKLSNLQEQQEIPMSLYCRQSRRKYLERQKDFIFDLTAQGIAFFETFFQFKFPFSKYDQIFCPEFNSGAMENAGAVTFTDDFLFSDEVDKERWGKYANTILHELSHMWFGNLVTMKWWNDLWLKESFADFISHFCLSRISINRYEMLKDNAWIQFNMRKSWGYREDQLITTHPIAGEVPNTDVARTIFDGITYAKGAATIKQLLFVVGENLFSESLAHFFDKFQFSNATLKDFILTLNYTYLRLRQVEFDFKSWQQQWIKSPGLNTCEALFDPPTCQQKMTIVQSAAIQTHDTLRRHKMKLALFDEKGNMEEEIIYLLPQFDTVIYFKKYNFKIVAVMPNFEDHTFIKVVIDPYSLNFFKHNLHLIQQDLTRTLIWRSIYEMVRDARLSTAVYLEVFKKAIIYEKKEFIVMNQFKQVKSAIKAFTPRAYRGQICEDMRQFTRQFIQSRIQEKNIVVALRPYLTSLAESEESILMLKDELISMNEEDDKISPNKIDVVSLIHSSEQVSREEKRKLYEKYILPFKVNQNLIKRCLVLDFTLEESKQLWSSFVSSTNSKSLKAQSNLMSAFNVYNKFPQFTQEWLNALPSVFKNSSKEYASLFYDKLFPRDSDVLDLQKKIKILLSTIEKDVQLNDQDQTFFLVIKLKQSIDDLSRIECAYSKFMQTKVIKEQNSKL